MPDPPPRAPEAKQPGEWKRGRVGKNRHTIGACVCVFRYPPRATCFVVPYRKLLANRSSMVDKDGYRPNIGVILCNERLQVLWARRCGRDAWQFPQGGIKPHETPEQALYRELWEEVGLGASDVELIGRTREWLRYEIPKRFLRQSRDRSFRGQKQIWFLLRLKAEEEKVRLNMSPKPEFDSWRWVEYWTPLEQIIDFKREVYRRALSELEPLLARLGLP